VRQISDGTMRTVTDSELKAARRALGAPSETTATATQAEGTTPLSRPRRAAQQAQQVQQAQQTQQGQPQAPQLLGVMLGRLAGMEDDEAASWLLRMDPSAAGAVLQRLAADDALRAIALRETMDQEEQGQGQKQEQEEEKGGSPASPAAAAAAAAAAAPEPMEEDEAVPEAPDAATDDDEATADGWTTSPASPSSVTKMKAEGAGAARPGRAAKRAALASLREQSGGDVSDAEPEEPASGDRRRSARVAAVRVASPPSAGKRQRRGDGSDKDEEAAEPAVAAPSRPAPFSTAAAVRAISGRGHTNRGRVKQKSHKTAELLEVGVLRAAPGWHNAGYIFPEGFRSRTLFRSSVHLDQLCVHECKVVGRGGAYWPAPTFVVVALDRPQEPLTAKSCTGCWTGVLKRINGEIERRRAAGEDLPPPPRTAIAGPEYFGFNQPNIVEAVEALDSESECAQYWAGKVQRERAAAGLPAAPGSGATEGGASKGPRAVRAPGPVGAGRGRGGRGRRRGGGSDSEGVDGGEGDEDDAAQYNITNHWSAVSRGDRYRQRLMENGEDAPAPDEDNPLPDLIDPITLEPVVRPAISPYGHVMGMATWRAVLAEAGVCPFTKQPLKIEQCRLLTVHNIENHRNKIIR
jgi:hypothetical protein